MVESNRSETFICRMCSSSSSDVSSSGLSSSATHCLPAPDLLRVDLLEARAFRAARDLALGRIRSRNRQVLRRAELLGDRMHPLDQLFDRGARRPHVVRAQVDELSPEAPANRAPEVLLDLA